MKIRLITIMFLWVILSSIVYAGDITTSTAAIDFLVDTNYIAPTDYKIDAKTISIDSEGYVFEKVKVQELANVTICTKTQSVTDINGTKTTQCIEYGTQEKILKDEFYVATLSFKGCNNGQWYRVWKHPDYVEDPIIVKEQGAIFGDYLCSNNQISFLVESFSTYTAEEITALQAGVLVYYSFDNSTLSGNTYSDLGTNDIDGTAYAGTLTQQPGKSGDAVCFDGTNDFFTSETTPFLDVDGFSNVTIQAWFKTGTNNIGSIVALNNTGASGWGGSGMQTWTGDLYNIRWGVGVNDVNSRENYNLAYANSSWILYTLVWSQGTSALYVNGDFKVGETSSNSLDDHDGTLTMGKSGFMADYWGGCVDEVVVYNRSLNESEMFDFMDITGQGYNIFTYPTEGGFPIEFTLTSQIPPDLNITNIVQPVQINYTISGANLSIAGEPYLNYTTLSPDDSCIIFTNGACDLFNGTYLKTLADTNTSNIFSYSFEENEILPAVYPYNITIIENTPKLFYNLSNSNAYVKIDLQNLTNTCARATLEGYFNASASGINRNIYYCNENYTSGKPQLNANCEVVGAFMNVSGTNHIHNLSYHDIAELSFCGADLSIPFSSSGSFIVEGGMTLTQAAYIPNSSGTSFYSTNAGTSYSALSGTWDMHFHHWDNNLTVSYYACGTGTDGGFNCSTVTNDTLEVGDSPQVPPIVAILTPEDGAGYDSDEAVFVSWFGFDLNGDSLTYNLSINTVQILSGTSNLNYTIPANSYTGSVEIEVTAYDGIDADTEMVTINYTLVTTGGGISQEELEESLDKYFTMIQNLLQPFLIFIMGAILVFLGLKSDEKAGHIWTLSGGVWWLGYAGLMIVAGSYITSGFFIILSLATIFIGISNLMD